MTMDNTNQGKGDTTRRGVGVSGLRNMQWIRLLCVPSFPVRFVGRLDHATSESNTNTYCRVHAPCGVSRPSGCVALWGLWTHAVCCVMGNAKVVGPRGR